MICVSLRLCFLRLKMMHQCEGRLKAKGKEGTQCPHESSYRFVCSNGNEQFFCGVHKPKEGVEPMPNARSSKAKATDTALSAVGNPRDSSPTDSVYNDIYEAILRRIKNGDVRDAPHFVVMTRMTPEEREIVIKRASEIAGTKVDVLLIAVEIGRVISEYNHARAQPTIPIAIGMQRLRNIGARWSPVKHTEGKDTFCNEEGSCVLFHDIQVEIINCSKNSGVDFATLSGDDNVVYMGPSDVIRTPMGEPVPREDSPWYIPLPRNCPLRQIHNKSEVIRILDAIKKGKNGETIEKYLALQGKTLACVCLPHPCHCEVYVEVIREILKSRSGGN